MEKASAPLRFVAIGLVRFYRYCISPFFAPSCRFSPSCSEYAITAFEQYGVCYGGYLAIKRLFKCHPFHSGGYDPVPVKVNSANKVQK